MKKESSFLNVVCGLAIPVALQSMLQSSFSIVDQIMIGQLGSVSVAGVGLAGKFASIYSLILFSPPLRFRSPVIASSSDSLDRWATSFSCSINGLLSEKQRMDWCRGVDRAALRVYSPRFS